MVQVKNILLSIISITALISSLPTVAMYSQLSRVFQRSAVRTQPRVMQQPIRGYARKPFNPYEVLGVKESASQEEIKNARNRLLKEHHPDHVAVNKKKQATTQTQKINKAYEQLTKGKTSNATQLDDYDDHTTEKSTKQKHQKQNDYSKMTNDSDWSNEFDKIKDRKDIQYDALTKKIESFGIFSLLFSKPHRSVRLLWSLLEEIKKHIADYRFLGRNDIRDLVNLLAAKQQTLKRLEVYLPEFVELMDKEMRHQIEQEKNHTRKLLQHILQLPAAKERFPVASADEIIHAWDKEAEKRGALVVKSFIIKGLKLPIWFTL